jgi:hypothetical protein
MASIYITIMVDATGFCVYVDDLQVRTATLFKCHDNRTYLHVKKPSGAICYNDFVTAANYQLILGMTGSTVAEFDALLEKLS